MIHKIQMKRAKKQKQKQLAQIKERRHRHERIIFYHSQTMHFAIPLLIVAIGAMYSERSGVINIALEGIMVMGAFCRNFLYQHLSGQHQRTASVDSGSSDRRCSRRDIFSASCICFCKHESRSDDQWSALNMFAPAFAIYVARMIQDPSRFPFTDTFYIAKVPVLGSIPVL